MAWNFLCPMTISLNTFTTLWSLVCHQNLYECDLWPGGRFLDEGFVRVTELPPPSLIYIYISVYSWNCTPRARTPAIFTACFNFQNLSLWTENKLDNKKDIINFFRIKKISFLKHPHIVKKSIMIGNSKNNWLDKCFGNKNNKILYINFF